MLVVDTSVLLAAADNADPDHDSCLSGTDASLIVLTERLNATVIATLDRRHFGVVRPNHVTAFELIP